MTIFAFFNMAVHGIEYAFGAHEHSTSGIFEVEPKKCPGFTFRKSILVGKTDLGPKEVRAFMEKLSEQYSGNTYNLIAKNCNHFCNDVCVRLTSKPIPKWVNRLAHLGNYLSKAKNFSCFLSFCIWIILSSFIYLFSELYLFGMILSLCLIMLEGFSFLNTLRTFIVLF